MKIIFLLLSGLFFFQINVLSQNGLFDERDKLYYREIISLYPKFLVSHLPENIDNKVSGAQRFTISTRKIFELYSSNITLWK